MTRSYGGCRSHTSRWPRDAMMARGAPAGAIAAWISAATVAATVILVAWVVVASWRQFDNSSHDWLLGLLGLWPLWAERARFVGLPLRPSPAGLPLVAAASAAFPVAWFVGQRFGHRGAVVWMLASTVLAGAAGLVLLEHGSSRLRCLAFPFLLLLLAIPPPGTLTTSLASALQRLATAGSALALQAGGIDALREGFVLQLHSGRLFVSEAGGGIRSLTILSTLGFVIAYYSRLGLPAGAGLALAAVPVALLGNVARIAGTGFTQEVLGPAAALGSFHELLGMVVVATGAAALYALAAGMTRVRARSAGANAPDGARPGPPQPPTPAWRIAAALCLALGAGASLVVEARVGEIPPLPALDRLTPDLDQLAWSDAPLDGHWAKPGQDAAVRRTAAEGDRTLGLFVGYRGSRLWSGPHDSDVCYPAQGFEPLSGSRLCVRAAASGRGIEASYRRYLEHGKPVSFLSWWQQGSVALDPHPGLHEWRNVYRILAEPPRTRGRLFVLLSLRGEDDNDRAISLLEATPEWLAALAYAAMRCAWLRRTQSLRDVIAAHAATNLLLGAYVLCTAQWWQW